MKNRYFAALAMAGLVSFAACGGDETEIEEGSVIAEDTGMVAPITPEPIATDTALGGGLPADTGAALTTDTAAHQ